MNVRFTSQRTRTRFEPEINSKLRSKGSWGSRLMLRMDTPGRSLNGNCFWRASQTDASIGLESVGGIFAVAKSSVKENFRVQLLSQT